MQMRIAFIFFVHGNGRIAQHGLRPRSCHRDELVRANYRIANFVELARNILVLHFEIGNRGPQRGHQLTMYLPR